MDIFEFDNLDDLWAHVEALKGSSVVRHRSLLANAVIDDLERDERFVENCTWSTASNYRPGDEIDYHRFTIWRKAASDTE